MRAARWQQATKLRLATPGSSGFTLIEIVVSSVVFAVLLLGIATIVNQAQIHWSRTQNVARQFRESRIAFDQLSRNLTQATLAPHWDYREEEDDGTGAGADRDNRTEIVPLRQERYQRLSELHFFVDQTDNRLDQIAEDDREYRSHMLGFHAPLGDAEHGAYRSLRALIAGRAYYLEFGDDLDRRPVFVKEMDDDEMTPRYRYRLIEYRPPSDRNTIYADGLGLDGDEEINQWYLPVGGKRDQPNPFARVLAENVIALIVSPRNATQSRQGQRVFELAPFYSYDSADPSKAEGQPPETQNLLPPLVDLTIVAISEVSASRLQDRWEEKEPPELAFDKNWFTETTRYYADLRALEQQLQVNNVEYRVFTSLVKLRSSQFSNLLKPPPRPSSP